MLRNSRASVVKCGGFSAAQAELNMSQSHISMHIGSLEKRLGYRLCERGKGGFRLLLGEGEAGGGEAARWPISAIGHGKGARDGAPREWVRRERRESRGKP